MENSDTEHQNKVLQECEEFLWNSRHQRRIALLKASGKTNASRDSFSKVTNKANRIQKHPLRVNNNRSHKDTEGICASELQRRQTEGECLRCAWPSDRKGSHRVRDCRRPIKLDNGTAEYKGKKSLRELSSDTE